MTDDNVAHLPAPKNRQPHLFGQPISVKPDPDRGRLQQTERTCPVCRLVRVTVHHPDGRAWREYRLGDSENQFADGHEPACTLAGQAAP